MAEYALYSTRQQRVLGVLPYLTAPFSVLGSSLILYTILGDGANTWKKSIYHRLILGMSLLDVLASLLGMIVFGPWAVPREAADFAAGARGTFGTCEAGGFFLLLLFGTLTYSGFLAVYFLLLIRFEWRERTMARYLEPLAHVFAFVVPVASGIAGVFLDSINPSKVLPGFCVYTDYPPDCVRENNEEVNLSSQEEEEDKEDDDVVCIRPNIIGDESSAGTIIFYFIVITIAVVLITLHVRKTERRIQQYAGGATNRLERTKETGKQGLMYIGAFFVTFFPMVLLELLYHPYHDRGFYFYVAALTKLTLPMQGFMNAYIYLRKRMPTLMEEGGRLSFLRHYIHRSRQSQKPQQQEIPGSNRTTALSSTQPALQHEKPAAETRIETVLEEKQDGDIHDNNATIESEAV